MYLSENSESIKRQIVNFFWKAWLAILVFIVIPIIIVANFHPFSLTLAENKQLLSYKIDRTVWEWINYDKVYSQRENNYSIKEKQNDLEIIRIALKLYHAKYHKYPESETTQLSINHPITETLERFANPLPQNKEKPFISNGYYYISDGKNYAVWITLNTKPYYTTNNETWAQEIFKL